MTADTDLSARMNEIVEKGRAEFPDFDTSSHFVVGMSADPMELRHTLGALGDDAHRVVVALAEDPDEAARILALRGLKLGAAIGKVAAKAAKPAEKTAAPAPKPDPVADLSDPNLPMKEWSKAWDKRQATRREQPKPTNRNIYDPNMSSADFNAAMDERDRERRAARRFR